MALEHLIFVKKEMTLLLNCYLNRSQARDFNFSSTLWSVYTIPLFLGRARKFNDPVPESDPVMIKNTGSDFPSTIKTINRLFNQDLSVSCHLPQRTERWLTNRTLNLLAFTLLWQIRDVKTRSDSCHSDESLPAPLAAKQLRNYRRWAGDEKNTSASKLSS